MDIGLKYWLSQATGWGASSEACALVYQELRAAYGSNNRHYHDLGHIEYMLNLANQHEDLISDKSAFYFAVWFHDVVQKFGCDSEALSAELAEKQLTGLGAPKALINKVQSLVLATKHHENRGLEGDEALLVDIDLSILGSQREHYRQYVLGCREEYPIPDIIYHRGRQNVLKHFLSQTHIFRTEVFRRLFEQQACQNLQWELEKHHVESKS